MTLRAFIGDPFVRRGALDMLAFAPALAAWGVVTGVAMTQSGLGVGLALLMSLTVYAGSAQLASLPLLARSAPMWVVWASAFCVNLRCVIFSAQWRVHLGHQDRPRDLTLAVNRPRPSGPVHSSYSGNLAANVFVVQGDLS